jgi:hypothetical protein
MLHNALVVNFNQTQRHTQFIRINVIINQYKTCSNHRL